MVDPRHYVGVRHFLTKGSPYVLYVPVHINGVITFSVFRAVARKEGGEGGGWRGIEGGQL